MKQLLIIIAPFILTIMAFSTHDLFEVKGIVTNRAGTRLKGISISVKGNKTKVINAADGAYSIFVPKPAAVLLFSGAGFKTLEVPVKGRPVINVMLDSQIRITGTVTDKNGVPVAGAAILIKGNKNGTSAAADGAFSLNADKSDISLMFSSTGYETKEVKTKGATMINVNLETDVKQLSEVVVIGYSTVRKKEMVGSVSSIAATALAGRVAGVQVNSTFGAAQTIRVRGSASIGRYAGVQGNSAVADFNTEGYDRIVENTFHKVKDNPLSTFSIDVDAASYSNVRRFINSGQLPPQGAVRIEEMINYFKYNYPAPDNEPFSVSTEISAAPWNSDHKLVLIGLQGKKVPTENLPSSNLVFLIDVSGSMMDADKLPLVKQSMKMLIDQLRPQDKVAMVAYAGNAGLVLPSTSGAEKIKLKDAVERLEAGGSTAGGAGIRLAYETAKNNFIEGGNNRVILCTDGDFNVGESSDDAMERLIENERKSGVFLTVLGYGTGNYQDGKMQKLADKGNGNHAYIDGIGEAKKVLVKEFGGTLFTIAKDVKLQVEFNPSKVQGYRLIGYENRILAKEDFNDDKKDAGDMGSGHTVTALYEIIPVGIKSKFLKKVDKLKYQDNMVAFSKSSQTDEVMTVKLRYKMPDADVSKLIGHPVKDNLIPVKNTSADFRFAAAVAEFGMLLRNSEFRAGSCFNNVLELAYNAKAEDEEGYRSEFIKLVKSAQQLSGNKGKEKEEETER